MQTRRGWEVIWRKTFVEVIPIDDLKEHLLGDECWCSPNIIRYPKGLPEIDHFSADGREEDERRERDGQHPSNT